MASAAWTWRHGCGRKAWKARSHLRAASIAGPSKSIPAFRATESSYYFTLVKHRRENGKSKNRVLSEVFLNHLPQSKRSLARAGSGTGYARPGRAAVIRKRVAQSDWNARLRAISEFAQRALPRAKHGRENS